MSADPKPGVTRRPVLTAIAAVLGIAAASGVAYEFGLFEPAYPSGSFDDVLAQLRSRNHAVMIGKAVRADEPFFDAKATETVLRTRLTDRTLEAVLAGEIDSGHLTEVKGWLLPQTLAQLCALAAV